MELAEKIYEERLRERLLTLEGNPERERDHAVFAQEPRALRIAEGNYSKFMKVSKNLIENNNSLIKS